MVFHHIKECSDQFIVFYSYDLVYIFHDVWEVLFPDFFYCCTICDRVGTWKCYGMSCFDCSSHTCCFCRFHTDHFDLWIQHFRKCRYTCDQSAAPDRCKDIINGREFLDNFHCNRSLSGSYIQIIERMYKSISVLFCKLIGLCAGIVIDISV